MSQQQSASTGRICFDNCSCCHTEAQVADHTCYLSLSHRANPVTPGAQQGSHWSTNRKVTAITRPGKAGIDRDSLPLARWTPCLQEPKPEVMNRTNEVKGATGPRKQTSAGQGLINISVITETGELGGPVHWCVSQCEVTRDGLTHRRAEGNERTL